MKLHTECLEIIKENYADSDPPSIEKCEDLLGAVSAGKRETYAFLQLLWPVL